MIPLRAIELPANAASALQALQAEVDALPSYADKVKGAPARFRSAIQGALRAELRAALDSASSGNSRCMFCEDSAADEVDHFRPKTLYPDETFRFPNYVYVCGACNKAKLHRFAVFAESDGRLVIVTRGRKDPVIAPQPGRAVLVNPRYEDPMRLLRLDITDSFYFHPLAQPGTDEHERAHYTIDLLKLNARDPLVRQRRQFFEIYRDMVENYSTATARRAPEEELRTRRDRIRSLGHPTVWFEMRRQHGSLPQLRELFASVPEALTWDSKASATARWIHEP